MQLCPCWDLTAKQDLPSNITETFFLFVKGLRSEEFCISRLQADSLGFNERFRLVNGHKFKFATKLLRLAGVSADLQPKWSHITSLIEAAKPKPLWELETEQVRQTLWTAKSTQILETSDSLVLQMLFRVSGELVAPLYLVLAGACSPLIVSSGGSKNKAKSISGTVTTSDPNTLLLFFNEMHCLS